MIKFDDVMKTLTDPGELSTFKQLKQAAALLTHYHDALVVLGSYAGPWDDEHREKSMRDFANKAIEGVSDE